jgi:hypothetical protein
MDLNTTEPGVVQYTIQRNQVITDRFLKNALYNKKGTLNVNWYGRFKDDLGTWSSLGTVSGVSLTDIQILKSLPGISTTKFILLFPSKSLVASTDDFASLMLLNLSFPASVEADVDRCGNNAANGTVMVSNVVSLKKSLVIHTASGIITVRNDSQVGLNGNN